MSATPTFGMCKHASIALTKQNGPEPCCRTVIIVTQYMHSVQCQDTTVWLSQLAQDQLHSVAGSQGGSICVGTAADAVMSTQRLTAQTVRTQRTAAPTRPRYLESTSSVANPATHMRCDASAVLTNTSGSNDAHTHSEICMTTQHAPAPLQLRRRHDIDSQ